MASIESQMIENWSTIARRVPVISVYGRLILKSISTTRARGTGAIGVAAADWGRGSQQVIKSSQGGVAATLSYENLS
ncbi:hypothetical protein, partial [Frankia sp. KB5]|uniref:hypothetical protein n=1 Tax=Frankia sp. KB5 TaxID=683318 RepID=UPI001A7E050B